MRCHSLGIGAGVRQLDMASVKVYDSASWTWPQAVVLYLVAMFFAERIQDLPDLLLKLTTARIPHRDRPRIKFDIYDKGYLFFNKCYTPIYLYHSIRFLWYCPNVLWSAETIAPLANVVIPFCAFFVIQDGFYTVFHWLLHKPALYPYIHKHHHRLRSCYKGLDDGQNTHPIEHFVGEYLFLWTWFLYTRLFPVHVFGVLLYMTASGLFSTMNHTRLDVTLPFGLYSVANHDTHHRLLNCNYSQYLSFWDSLLFDAFIPYDKSFKEGSRVFDPEGKVISPKGVSAKQE